ncbi:bifunctional hydroxymethylpyrimidine kinase/phosphomethylpyrimidine kinase [Motilibacter aurantiacus]|uniref:bifunctional hydroxymethylpyrimidine kinase/phosphomethylpyrimidine kinase n=1 Tax=Motilibacter aurantiacus TaxID=2714955 RepID=UPI0014084283|nr:bifunctional hydroxymethylpyrimidine kinase/phosphomethylpyrimidine kinase [Motilibacter aurantiacus]NHC44682.1 bifunctional hydroxymethylpyrimidine kinase/phosphomethylpyrimidine kinase [Motilibacter aurantiacus]
MTAAIVLSVAGSDPSGGAGIQADLKAFSAMGAYGGAVLTALTAQSTRGVTGVLPVPAEFVTAQLDAVLDDLDVRAVKVGMLGGADVVAAVAEAFVRHEVPQVVVDPVMVATSGDRLVDEATVDAIRELLVPLATVLTPNLPEAATLLRRPSIEEDEMQDAGNALRQMGSSAVLVKGGHLAGPSSTDVLVDADGVLELTAARVDTRNTHGTGCTLSSAIAAGLALGMPMREAVQRSKDYLTDALRAADGLGVGSGSGPVHHFVGWWAA